MKLKILHVSNVAQNAYINASILSQRGHDCDVAAYDLYHFACSPEWYHLTGSDIDPDRLGAQYFPNFYALGRSIPQSPAWVALGPQINVLKYLNLRRTNDPLASIARDVLNYLRFKATIFQTTMPQTIDFPERDFVDHFGRYDLPEPLKQRILSGRVFDRLLYAIKLRLFRFNDRLDVLGYSPPFPIGFLDAAAALDGPMNDLLQALRRNGLSSAVGLEFDGAADRANLASVAGVTSAELAPYTIYAKEWRELAKHYDICLFYGDSAVHALTAGIPLYCALEHGTIRAIPFEAGVYSRLVREAYLNASKVFITNTDYVSAERRLEFRPDQRVYLPHPFDEQPTDAFIATAREARFGSSVIFFCPARQDWVSQDPKMAKGNDVYFRAAAALLRKGVQNFKLFCIDWGVDQQASRELIDELGLRDNVVWLPPMSKLRLWRQIVDANAVLDQFLISVISGVGFETLALGRRLITRDDGVNNVTFFGEGPPSLSAGTDEELEARMMSVINDPQDEAGIGARGTEWIKRHHSAEKIVATEMAAFLDVLRLKNMTGHSVHEVQAKGDERVPIMSAGSAH